MDNRNLYNNQQPNNFYSYGYPAAGAPLIRQEIPAYMMPSPPTSAGLKGRPVSSFEEARVAQIDLDGSVTFFPDLGNKRIYTKRINIDGTASIQTFSLDETPLEPVPTEYATHEEVSELKKSLEEILARLAKIPNSSKGTPTQSIQL